MLNEPLRLGYACINTALREDDIFSSRSIILANANLKGRVQLEKLVIENIRDTATILKWNEDHGIRNFRLSSVVFPHYTNPRLEYKYNMEFADEELRNIGNFARENGHRVTTHPDHFSYQIASETPIVVEHAFADLQMHDEMLRRIGLDDSIMTIHGGGVYGDRTSTMTRWSRAFGLLPESVRRRICIENDEWNWGVDDLLPICERFAIPFVFDWFHNEVSSRKATVDDRLIRRILATWGHGHRPLMHYSEQAKGSRIGAHSQMTESLPRQLLEIPTKFKTAIDVDLEVKLKEQAVLAMYNKYFDKTHTNGRLIWKLRE